MADIRVFPSRTMRHNDQRDNPSAVGIPAGSDCWYTSAAMCLSFVGIGDAQDQAVVHIKGLMEGSSLFRKRLSAIWPELNQPSRLAIFGELGALWLSFHLKETGRNDLHVVWSPGYLVRHGVREAIERSGWPIVLREDPQGRQLVGEAKQGHPAILSTLATPSGHYIAVSGAFVVEGWRDGGLRIEDPFGRYPYRGHQPDGAGAGNLHTFETLARMRKGLGWRYAQLIRGPMP